MRKLASVRAISEIRPIRKADAVECAVVDGWTVVVKKGQFAPGDLVAYFEIDSFLPIRREFEFLRATSYRNLPNLGEGFRLRSITIRGQLSQGLVLPLSDLPIDSRGLRVGDDLTELLGVKKFEAPIPPELVGKMRGERPGFIPNTSLERAQNLLTEIFSDNRDGEFEVSVKLDGASMTIYHHNGTLGVCSHGIDLLLNQEGNVYVDTAKRLGILPRLSFMGRNVALQGELIGPGIEGNREGLDRHAFYLFAIVDLDTGRYLSHIERVKFMQALMEAGCSISHVPMVDTHFKIPGSLDDLLEMADGESLFNPVREGLVFRRPDTGFSFKVISNKYLLKEAA